MAIAFNAATDGGNNGGTTNSQTWSHTCSSGANRLLIAAIIGDNTTGGSHEDVTGVTYNGVAMTLAAKNTTLFTNNRYSYLYYLLNPASGANNLVASCTATHYLICGSADYTGVQQSGQPDATTTNCPNTGNIATLTTSITTINDNCWTILVENGFAANTGPQAGTGSTNRAGDAAFGSWGIFDSGGVIHPAGSYSMTTTRSNASNSISHIIASFQPAGAAAAWTPVNKIQRNWLRR